MYGYIYKTTNLNNTKIYIGKHNYDKRNSLKEKQVKRDIEVTMKNNRY